MFMGYATTAHTYYCYTLVDFTPSCITDLLLFLLGGMVFATAMT